jgi:uncharacterized protein
MNTRGSGFQLVLLALLAIAPAMAVAQSAEAPPKQPAKAPPKQFLYLLHLAPRTQVESAWSAADHAAVDEHFKRLQQAAAAGKVILAGRTDEPPDKTFGIVIFEAESEDAARKFMEDDPAVKAGVMTATLHPYAVALERKH